MEGSTNERSCARTDLLVVVLESTGSFTCQVESCHHPLAAVLLFCYLFLLKVSKQWSSGSVYKYCIGRIVSS